MLQKKKNILHTLPLSKGKGYKNAKSFSCANRSLQLLPTNHSATMVSSKFYFNYL